MEEAKEVINHVMQPLFADLRSIIDKARQHVASTANYELTMMYWHIGERINREILDNQRAEYGNAIVSQVATQLQNIYGTKGFELRNIRRMIQFVLKFPDEKIVSTLLTKFVTVGRYFCDTLIDCKYSDYFMHITKVTSLHDT